MIDIPESAVALRPVRFLPNDDLRYYFAITFPRNPYGGCLMYLRRCEISSGIAKDFDDAAGICDILNDDGDIVGDYFLTKKGLKYLYKALGTRVDNE